MRRLLIGLVGVLTLASGCAQSESATESPVLSTGSSVLPGGNDVAWRTYADYVVVVHVDREKRLPLTEEESKAEEGLEVRKVDLTVSSVVWSQPETKREAPTRLTWSSGGWIMHGDAEQVYSRDNVPWLVVGHDYVVPIAFTTLNSEAPPEEARWIPVGSENAIPADGGELGAGETIMINDEPYEGKSPDGSTPMRDSVWGRDFRSIADILGRAKVDPAARRYMDLMPVPRYEAVVDDLAKR